MKLLVDYENVNVSGLSGIEQLNAEDKVEIYYSDKNNKMDMSVVETVHDSACKVAFVKVDKTAPNYLDFQIVCRASQILNADLDQLAIISKDKGYISVQDFYAKMGREVILAEDILSAAKYRKSVAKEMISAAVEEAVEKYEEKTECDTALTETAEPDIAPITPIQVTLGDVVPGNEEPIAVVNRETATEAAAQPIKRIKKLSQTRKLTEEEKLELKEALSDLPKHNGQLQQCVLDCFRECSTLGQMHYKLVSTIGRCDGEKTYAIIATKFAEFKGLKVEKTA